MSPQIGVTESIEEQVTNILRITSPPTPVVMARSKILLKPTNLGDEIITVRCMIQT